MMISETGQPSAYVWFQLPGQSDFVLCGRVTAQGPGADAAHDFIYGRRYRARDDAVPLLPHALPVRGGVQSSLRGLPGVLRDAAPDAWGRRVLMHRLRMPVARAEAELTEIDYLLHASQSRPGALRFSASADEPPSHPVGMVSLEQLSAAVEAVEQGAPLPPELDAALLHGTSIGGARPKALLEHDGKAVVAKFSAGTDVHPMVRLEQLGLYLGRAVGIRTVTAARETILGKDTLLVDRFDLAGDDDHRHFFSALTALDLDEMEARYASYPELADYLRRFAAEPVAECRELFRRMVFNILIGNTDDHARNHALFWDGRSVSLTPAYDLCVMPRTGQETTQAMEVGRMGKHASLANALSECERFGLSRKEAIAVADEMQAGIRDTWPEACEAVGISRALQDQLLGRAVLSPVALQT